MLPMILSYFNKKDNEAEIKKIYEEHYGLMISVANSILKDHALAEDAVSESLMKINRNLKILDKLNCYQKRAYIVNIVRNTSFDFFRKQSKDKVILDVPDDFLETIPDTDANILERLIVKESCTNIKEAVKSLPKPLQDVLFLSAVCERTNAEISDELGISRDAAKMKLYRAKKAIKKLLVGDNDGK
jgi:RNA polymerase sigma-70 factor (ECF subfamily)